jgi:hypothetical protein
MQSSGKSIPSWMLAWLQRFDLVTKLHEKPEVAEFLQKIESIQVKDNKIIFRP